MTANEDVVELGEKDKYIPLSRGAFQARMNEKQ
jgi:hypothetical protein